MSRVEALQNLPKLFATALAVEELFIWPSICAGCGLTTTEETFSVCDLLIESGFLRKQLRVTGIAVVCLLLMAIRECLRDVVTSIGTTASIARVQNRVHVPTLACFHSFDDWITIGHRSY